eukprot:CAMPEP_0171135636 /NCGR_PEP_ID=MMETSP0766_2-20121228/130144_1 /TAXON_ID=439317 /ORGANISM="Gambierdiscus australes, Strain CAWD 149" /LENGTH=219 /DNA_ID=CAMNT_0011599145 /DNA_START=1 /DNA_END=658 /DNA_ORIENTATION=-
MSGWAVQFNKNPFGLAPAAQLQLPEVAPSGGTAQTLLPMLPNNADRLSGSAPTMPLYLEVAINTNIGVFYLSIGYDLSAVLMEAGPVSPDAFQQTWRQVPEARKARTMGQFGQRVTPEMVISRMKQYYIYLVAQMEGQDADLLYFSAGTTNKLTIFCELSLQRSAPGVQLLCCSDAPPMVPLFQGFVQELLRVRWQGALATPDGLKWERVWTWAAVVLL